MTQPCPDPGYRWAKPNEGLVDGEAAWYDEDPPGTIWPEGFPPPDEKGVLHPPFDWILKTQRERKGKEWPSDSHGLCGVVVPIVIQPDALPDSPFRIDDPPELIDPMQPIKTKVRPDAVKAILEEFFPSAIVRDKARIGGRTFWVSIWRYRVEISVTLEAMTEIEASGDATFTFSENPRDPKKKPILIEQFTSGHLGDIREAVEKTRMHVMGIVQAIRNVCDAPRLPPPVNILED